MSLPNEHFQDFPIEFKEINPEDFPEFQIYNNSKIIIEPNEIGYINEPLQQNIDIEVKNTVVVNAAVGQGKTYSILRIIKRLYDANEDYLIFVASPFVSLVEQYFNELINIGLPENQIYRYEYLGERPNVSYLDKKIQIITVNSLLGNPGEDAYINSDVKREYLSELKKLCERKGKKVVVIMDEIHDAIQNFKEEYIFNLWKWKNVLHKNIILSATYNEASKVVIEYMAELTDDKIKIIESARTRIPANQSELYLHYNPALYYSYKDELITEVVSDLVDKGKEVDILSYSKTLADNIINSRQEGIGKILYHKYQEINNCTSDLRYNQRKGRIEIQNRFDNNKCNVGTNFKTGVSITKRNHAFVIIMPPEGSKLQFKNQSGIFSNGVNSVIQALARQRKRGGEIHIILPLPEHFDYETLPFRGDRRKYFKEFYDGVKSFIIPKHPVKYVPLNLQKMIIESFYEDKLKANITDEISMVNNANRQNRLSLIFPEFKSYLLENGESYLSDNIKFFGADLSAYITYSAITNQFINCNFKGYTSKPPMNFETGKFQLLFDYYFGLYMGSGAENLFSQVNDMYKYFEFKRDLFNNFRINFYDGSITRIKPNKNREFEQQLLSFIISKLYSSFNSRLYQNGELVDYAFTRSDYFIACISHVSSLNIDELSQNGILLKRVKVYQTLNYFRNKLIESIANSYSSSRGEYQYVLRTAPVDFVAPSEVERFIEMIDFLCNNDYFLSNNIFEFKQRFKPRFTLGQKVKSFYSKLVEDFFDTEPDKLTSIPRRNIYVVKNEKTIPEAIDTIDFITPADVDFPEEYLRNSNIDSLVL